MTTPLDSVVELSKPEVVSAGSHGSASAPCDASETIVVGPGEDPSAGWVKLGDDLTARRVFDFASSRAEDDWFTVEDEAAFRIGAANVSIAKTVVNKFPIVVDDRRIGRVVQSVYPGAKVSVRSMESNGSELSWSVYVTGLPGDSFKFLDGDCFYRLCQMLGLFCPRGASSPAELSFDDIVRAKAMKDMHVKVTRRLGYLLHPDNHLELVDGPDSMVFVSHKPGQAQSDVPLLEKTIPVAELFDSTNIEFYVNYFSSNGSGQRASGDGEFGSLRASGGGPDPRAPVGAEPLGGTVHRSAASGSPPHHVPLPPGSVVAEDVRGGASNVSNGVVRRARRNLNPTPAPSYAVTTVSRNYAVSGGVLFNNLQEMVLDSISPDHAQEILEEVFAVWGLPFDNPRAMKYAEDLVFTFLVATTASDKADYNRVYDLPAVPGSGELLADFKVLSDTVVIGHRLTRRQFVRGLSDRLRLFIRADENAALQAQLADRAGCQYQYGDLCFDGSTHCIGLTPSERAFVRTLEARNLFESDTVLAAGASDKLLTGFNQRQAPRLTAP